MPKPSGSAARRKAVLLGVGLDSDGHKRVTTGPNFALLGGSKETHAAMTEKAIKLRKDFGLSDDLLRAITGVRSDNLRTALKREGLL